MRQFHSEAQVVLEFVILLPQTPNAGFTGMHHSAHLKIELFELGEARETFTLLN